MLEFTHQELANDIWKLNSITNFGRVAFHAHAPIFKVIQII